MLGRHLHFAFFCCAITIGPLCPAEEIDYARHIRPILANKCYACHGPDEAAREAELRLDFAAEDQELLDREIVIPGQPASSELIARVRATDQAAQMPPPDSGLTLSGDEIDLLERWISAGARVDQHWAFRRIVRPPLPQLRGSPGTSEIDRFVLARLNSDSIDPSPRADRRTLIRRLFLDLLGVLPSPEQVDAFVSDASPAAYSELVDRTLASPHYGERWGRHWLDQARYADTNGYTVDSERSMWPFRDWVIHALNDDMPFDQFTIEQLAGDLLTSPSQSQLIATGFHRNTLINQEGGTDKEQFRVESVVDRVNTTGAVWMGLTVGCAQCHDHKFDPVSTRDYYQLFAFFNSQQDVNSTSPTLRLATATERHHLRALSDEVAAAKAELAAYDSANPSAAKPGDQPGDPRRVVLQSKVVSASDARKEFAAQLPVTMVMAESTEPRVTHILVRGDFLRLGSVVAPDVPKTLPALPENPETNTRRNRLDLARWLVSRGHPLTARVTANRIWGHYFGRGLVETENDFGIQGRLPTHAELLDWLAAELIETGWSLKSFHRLLLTSDTYCRSSHARPDLHRIDPLNQLLARQNRLRVEAEIIRDIGLDAAGLLVRRIGGPSVRPPQPSGVYAFTQRQASWKTSQGADRYRRGMYTFFMRSAPYPMLTTFDTPRFNTTCTQRGRSNTPLQSLTMANDETMFENARALGRRLYHFASQDSMRIVRGYEVCFARQPTQEDLERLRRFCAAERSGYSVDTDSAHKIVGAAEMNELAVADLASCTALARVLLNLDEFIVRE